MKKFLLLVAFFPSFAYAMDNQPINNQPINVYPYIYIPIFYVNPDGSKYERFKFRTLLTPTLTYKQLASLIKKYGHIQGELMIWLPTLNILTECSDQDVIIARLIPQNYYIYFVVQANTTHTEEPTLPAHSSSSHM